MFSRSGDRRARCPGARLIPRRSRRGSATASPTATSWPRADPCERRRRRRRQELPAAGVPRRPGARPRRRRDALRRLPRGRKATCRAAWPSSCAARPAPRSPTEWELGALYPASAARRRRSRSNRSVLADVCEAVIGAVFLDGGYAAARAVIEKAFGAADEGARRAAANPKTVLQEWALAPRPADPGLRDGRAVRAPTTRRASASRSRSRASSRREGTGPRSARPSRTRPRTSSCAKACGSVP